MPDNESSIYHVNKIQGLPPKSAEVSLITLERAQKLDLLIHLISNLRQSLVICGPSGIGKTVLLDELRACKKEVWPIVNIEGSSNLSFESIQGQLFRFLTQIYAEHKNQGLSSILSVLDKQNQKIVVIIDDAGRLVPGLITTLIEYAAASACLRIVFSLTHDELHIKNSSDRAIDECHFIEIPPLTEKQCAVFLQNLSAQPGAIVSFNAINDRLVEKLYRETHGLPGKIISELPSLSNYNAVGSYKWGAAALLIILLVSTVGISWLITDEPDLQAEKEIINTPVILQKAEVVDISSPVVNSVTNKQGSVARNELLDANSDDPAILLASAEDKSSVIADAEKMGLEKNVQQLQDQVEPVAIKGGGLDNEPVEIHEKKTLVVVEQVPAEKIPVKQVPVVEKAIEKPRVADKLKAREVKIANNVTVTTPVVRNALAKKDDKLWVLAQAGKNQTIQLMVLSKREAVLEFFRKHGELKGSLRFFQVKKQGQEKYVVVYGWYKNKAIASKQMKTLPIKYRKSWVRSFADLQNIINN